MQVTVVGDLHGQLHLAVRILLCSPVEILSTLLYSFGILEKPLRQAV